MENISQMSLLEVAVMLMEQKKAPQSIRTLIKEVLEMKGLEDVDLSLSTQLYIDITTSSNFVFCGDGKWDLKIRQSLDLFDKDGSFFNTGEEYEDEEEIIDLDDYNVEDEYDDDDDDEDEDEEDYDDYDDSLLDDLDPNEDDDENDFLDEQEYNDIMDDYEDMYEK